MVVEELCVVCLERPVEIKKRKLCGRCYKRANNEESSKERRVGKRKQQKLKHDKVICECGQLKSRRAKKCTDCRKREHLERYQIILEMRAGGVSNADIGIALGTNSSNISSIIWRMRKKGIEVPKSSYDHHTWMYDIYKERGWI